MKGLHTSTGPQPLGMTNPISLRFGLTIWLDKSAGGSRLAGRPPFFGYGVFRPAKTFSRPPSVGLVALALFFLSSQRFWLDSCRTLGFTISFHWVYYLGLLDLQIPFFGLTIFLLWIYRFSFLALFLDLALQKPEVTKTKGNWDSRSRDSGWPKPEIGSTTKPWRSHWVGCTGQTKTVSPETPPL